MMMDPRRQTIRATLAMTAMAFGSIIAATACTPATPDSATGSGGQGQTGTGGSSVNVGGSGGSIGSGGSGTGQSGGSVGSGGSASGGSVGSGGSPANGAGGRIATATGGSTGSAGAGGASAGKGCNWVHNADGTLAFGTPDAAAKIVLFDGTTLSGWHKLNMPGVPIDWKLLTDGTMQVVPSGTGQATEVQSNLKFEDLCLHVEYMTPVFPSTTTDVQKQGNSGVYLKSAYEMQILDTHTSGPLIDGCGAVYKVMAPLVVACNMSLVWNTYEIEFRGSVWNGSTKIKDAEFVQVTLNGKLVQMNVDLPLLVTQAGINDLPGPQPVGLQDHLDLVSFRNIWATIPQY